MLQRIRDKSGSLIIKIIFSIIGVSFVFFGVVDVVRILTAIPPVAKVDGIKIGFQDFYEAYQKQVAALNRRGVQLTTKRMKEQVAKQILQGMVSDAVLEHEPRKQGILVSQDLVTSYLHSLPVFQKDGKFDSETFQGAVRQLGIQPQKLVNGISQDLAMQQFLLPMASGLRMEDAYADELLKTFCGKRQLEIVFIPSQKTDKEFPSDEALEQWLKEHKKQYKRPAQRSVDVILIPHEQLAKGAVVTEESLREAYEERKDEWGIPEIREIKALRFDAESDAIAAKSVLLGSMTDERIKKLVPGADLVTIQEAMLVKEDAEVIHTLREGENYGPVLRQGKWLIYIVTKVTPASTKKFEEVKEQLEEDLRKAFVNSKIKDLKDKVEDAFASGQPFEEVSKIAPLRRVSFPALVREKAEEILKEGGLEAPVIKVVLSQAFDMEKGEEGDFTDVQGYSVMLQIKDVKKKELPKLEAIRQQVVKDWQKEADQEKTLELATTKFGKVENLNEWQQAVKEGSFKANSYAVSRFDTLERKAKVYEIFDGDAIERLLLSKMHTVVFLQTKDKRVAVAFIKGRTDDVSLKLGDENIERVEGIKKALMGGFSEEAAELVRASIVGSHRLKINKDSMKKVLSLSTSN